MSSPIYNKKIAGGVFQIIELIVVVYDQFEKRNWTTRNNSEIGFYIKNKVTKSNVFLGIWDEVWETFEVPLCIAVDYRGKAPYEMGEKLKKYVASKEIKGVQYKDFQEHSVFLFEERFFSFDDEDADKLGDILEWIRDFVGINEKQSSNI